MLKHKENNDGHLASISKSLATIADVLVKLDESGRLDRLAADGCPPAAAEDAQAAPTANPAQSTPPPTAPFVVTEAEIEAGYWMSRKEAWDRLGVVKSTLEAMINSGELTAYHKTCDRKKKRPYVWLKRSAVDELYTSYTLRNGKEKKVDDK